MNNKFDFCCDNDSDLEDVKLLLEQYRMFYLDHLPSDNEPNDAEMLLKMSQLLYWDVDPIHTQNHRTKIGKKFKNICRKYNKKIAQKHGIAVKHHEDGHMELE